MSTTFPLPEFENYPIEFKEINPEDFPDFKIKDDRKTIIEPNGDGYIKEALLGEIDILEKNTVVINCAVGQGKTTSILNLIKQYDREEYFVFIASPFVSLVNQYYEDLIKEEGIEMKEVYRYEFLDKKNIGLDYSSVEHFMELNDEDETYYEPLKMPFHIITINSLIGNPGDEFISSSRKREYLKLMSSYCKNTNKKVVFIYDEIHDSIDNFKEEYIFNLWKWSEVIQKNYILSATYSESSKIVIEYLAELTENNIQIIESKRIKNNTQKQSKLFLHFNNLNNYTYKDDTTRELVKTLITKNKEVDILCYSKKLSEDIVKLNEKNTIGGELKTKYKYINLCVGTDFKTNSKSNPRRFKNSECNVGTNFKSGVNITKENHALIIIFPPNPQHQGIFTSGTNTVIQAIARQRKKGEIHLILPPPKL